MMKKKLKIAEVAFVVAGASIFVASWIMSYWMWKTMPTRPEGDFVIPMINHGRTIYLSLIYSVLFNALFWGGLTLVACAVLIDFYKDPFNWRNLRK